MVGHVPAQRIDFRLGAAPDNQIGSDPRRKPVEPGQQQCDDDGIQGLRFIGRNELPFLDRKRQFGALRPGLLPTASLGPLIAALCSRIAEELQLKPPGVIEPDVWRENSLTLELPNPRLADEQVRRQRRQRGPARAIFVKCSQVFCS